MANTITLRSSDGETFEVEEDVALCVPRRRYRDATRMRREFFVIFPRTRVDSTPARRRARARSRVGLARLTTRCVSRA